MWSAFMNGFTLVLFAAYAVVSLVAIGYWAWGTWCSRIGARRRGA